MKTLILAIVIIAFATVGAFAQRDYLSTAQWTLTQAHGKPVTNSNAYFEINIGRTRFTGNTGCNRMFGTVSVRGRQIDFSNIGTTKRMCKMMAGSVPEGTFTKALDDAVRYLQNGNTLNLYDRRGRSILKFKRLVKLAPEGDNAAGLGDKKWMLESIKDQRTLVAINGVFVVFDPNKGSAGGDTGCNVFGGSYKSTDKTISITEIISTMRACIEDDRMIIEREFLDGLRTSNRYEIKDGRLFLYQNTKLLLTMREENK